MTVATASARRDARIFEDYGVVCTHTPKVGDALSRRVIIDRNVQRMGLDAQVTYNAVELSFLISEGAAPRRGETVAVASTSETFTVDAPIEHDGSVVRVAVT